MQDRYLFKAKRIDNGEWIQGYVVQTVEGSYIVIPYKHSTILGKGSIIEINPSTICQCTGLKDKNGKLIWENDICDRKEEHPEIVKYNEGDWTLDYSYSKGKESGYCYCNLGFYAFEREYVEVIGNIFDNKDLLKREVKKNVFR